MAYRPESVLAHEAWPELVSDPEARELADLRAEYRGHWAIWRAVSAQWATGAWCARRTSPGRPSTGVSAQSPEGLRERIRQAHSL